MPQVMEPFCRLKEQTAEALNAVWCAINAILGISGNLLTLLAIPYAAKRRL